MSEIKRHKIVKVEKPKIEFTKEELLEYSHQLGNDWRENNEALGFCVSVIAISALSMVLGITSANEVMQYTNLPAYGPTKYLQLLLTSLGAGNIIALIIPLLGDLKEKNTRGGR